MSTTQTNMESTPSGAFTLEEIVPIGTFAGSKDFVLRIRHGKPVAANTGDQGGGQN
jgi:hypothetical protein